MITSTNNRRIAPETIAYKLAAMRNFYTPKFQAQVKDEPRMVEFLWFVQWASMQPGGLVKFVQDFLDAHPDRVGTPAMRRIGANASYGASERDMVLEEIPAFDCAAPDVVARFWASVYTRDLNFKEIRNVEALKKLDYDAFHRLCLQAALNDLLWRLQWFCGLPAAPRDMVEHHWRDENEQTIEGEDRCLEQVWYFRDLPGALIKMMASHARRVSKQLAMTETATKVFDALEFALAERATVSIEGDTRLGKSQSVNIFCSMHPGTTRLVRTPSSNREYDLLKAIADAVGIEVPLGMSRRELQAKVEFVIQYGGLFLVMDEAHFLFPRNVSRNTSPARLDWVRTQIIDKGLPLALVSTPQEFQHSLRRFTRTTSHNIAQFLGRIALTVPLPSELKPEDLIAVARIRFPELPQDYLELIAAKSMQSEKYLMTFEAIAKRWRYIARRKDHATDTMEDLELAISEVVRIAPLSPGSARPGRMAKPVAAVATAAVSPKDNRSNSVPDSALTIPARQTSPTLATA